MNFNCSYTDIVPLHKLVENPKNTNIHPEKQIKLLAKIIDYQGQRAPIVVSKQSGFVVKGHGRLKALQLLEWESAAVDMQEYESEAQEYADLEADNRIAEFAYIDESKAKDQIEDILGPEFDLDLIAIDQMMDQTDWDEGNVDSIKEDDNPAQGTIKVSCPEDIKKEVKDFLIHTLKDQQFRDIKID